MREILLQPQKGPQTDFLACKADIAIYGGAAGGGKTYGLLLDPLRAALTNDNFNAVIFRREATDLTKPGAIWSDSHNIYSMVGGHPNNQSLYWRFNKQSVIKFAGLQYEKDKLGWQGSQLDFLGFDELTHFTEEQFWYLIARVRSASGCIKPYTRATCNPEPNWCMDLIKWWLNKDGYPIPERAGTLRWYFRLSGVMHWYATLLECWEGLKEHNVDKRVKPMSFTFIPATLEDNQILLQNDPAYYSRLASLDPLERKKMLEGCWFSRPVGRLFKADHFKTYAIDPPEYDLILITTDTAQETKTANDYTVFQVWGRCTPKIYLIDQIRGKFDFMTQKDLLKSLIAKYKPHWVGIEEAANGKPLIQTLRREIAVPVLHINRANQREKGKVQDKYMRAAAIMGYVQEGYVHLNTGHSYYAELISELTQFSEKNKALNIHDDQVDCLVDAVYYLLYNKISQLRDTSLKEEKIDPRILPYGPRRDQSCLYSVTDERTTGTF